ncbi:substrate-binding domain-containing protein [Eoetvoesiella caeni]
MTYKFRARLDTEWVLEKPDGSSFVLSDVLRLLASIESLGHIAGACRACNVSYRHAWGLLRHAEKELERPLLETSRRQGTKLTRFAQQLLWANRRIDVRLAPVLDGMTGALQEELQALYTESRPRLRMHASHGFAVEGLMQAVDSQEAPSIELRYRTAIEALASLNRGECDLAGFQVPVGEFQDPILQHYKPWLDPEKHSLIYLAQRETGFFVQPGNPRNIRTVADLGQPGVRFVNRQVGSSTRLLVSLMLRQKGIDPTRIQGFDTSEFTHLAVAAHIVGGMADVGVGVETAAWRCGLDFIPLAKERYFFAVQRDSLSSPLMRQFIDLLLGDSYQSFVGQLAGYDATGLGKVLSPREAFETAFDPLSKAA